MILKNASIFLFCIISFSLWLENFTHTHTSLLAYTYLGRLCNLLKIVLQWTLVFMVMFT